MATKKHDNEVSSQGNQQTAGKPASEETRGIAGQFGGQSRQRRQAGLARQGTSMPSMFGASPFDLMQMSPFALMRRFTEEMDRMFEDFSMGSNLSASQSPGGFRQEAGFFTPQVEVFEREGQLVVRADLPGMNKDNVHIEVVDEGILLEGERRYEHQDNQRGVYRSERSYGSFRRLVPLPEEVDVENATATFRDGVLEITMPVPQRQSRGRRIEIQSTENREAQTDQAQTTTAGKR